MNLGKQLYPYNSKVFMEGYQDAISKPHGYLVIDCNPKSPRELKMRIIYFLMNKLYAILVNEVIF